MPNEFKKYEPALLEIIGQHDLQAFRLGEDRGGDYVTCCDKLLPTTDRPNRRSRVLKIVLSQESAEDQLSVDDFKKKLNHGMSGYDPNHDSSYYELQPEPYQVIV